MLKTTLVSILYLCLILAGGSLRAYQLNPPVEICLRGGTLFDGSGSQGIRSDLAIDKGKIVGIGDLSALPSLQSIDCTGLSIAPGFIDLHNHSDDSIVAPKTRSNVCYVTQGCTSIVTGNCGSGPIHVKKYLDRIDEQGAGTNVIHLLPHGDLRSEVMGKESRDPTSDELDRMRSLARKAMEDGAWGMSTGLIYVPGTYAKTAELVAIAKVVAEFHGIYASHIRNEGGGLMDAIGEAIQIGKEAQLPIHVSHFKATGKANWGSLHVASRLIESARANGLTVTADQYPYTASSTSLEATLLPAWCREGGRKSLEKRLADPMERAKIRDAVAKQLQSSQKIQIASYAKNRAWAGKSLDEIAKQLGKEVVDVVMEIESNGGAGVVNFGMSEEDVRMAMSLPWVATASDGGAKIPSSDRPHPRSYGTFSRKVGRYAVEEATLPIEHAIRSCSGLPADILGLTDRGYLRTGLVADIIVLDPTSFRDVATYEDPFGYSTGIVYAYVEGTPVVYNRIPTGALPGKSLRKPPGPPAANSSRN